MKLVRILNIILLLNVLLFINCKKHPDNEKNQVAVQLQASNYFPTAMDSSWKYKFSYSGVFGSGEYTITNRVISSGNEIEMKSENSLLSSTQYVLVTYVFNDGSLYVKSNTSYLNGDLLGNGSYTPMEVVIPGELKTGTHLNYDVTFSDTTNDPSAILLITNVDVTIDGYEDVYVQAGTFKNALKITSIYDGEMPTTMSRWYADGVGLIKEESIGEGELPTVRWELVSYTIGQKSEPVSVQVPIGCYASGSSQVSGWGSISYSLNDYYYDQKMNQEVYIQRNFYSGIPANVYIWHEPSPNDKNALSAKDGNIYFGYYLFYYLLNYSELANAGVLAHEWAHQVQYRYGWSLGNPAAELEADAFSGYYMALQKQWAWNNIQGYYAATFNNGDYSFNSPQHHGTPQQRLSAVYLGLQTALQVMQSQQPYSYAQLHQMYSQSINGTILKTSNNFTKPFFKAMLALDEVEKIAMGLSSGAEVVYPVLPEGYVEKLKPF